METRMLWVFKTYEQRVKTVINIFNKISSLSDKFKNVNLELKAPSNIEHHKLVKNSVGLNMYNSENVAWYSWVENQSGNVGISRRAIMEAQTEEDCWHMLAHEFGHAFHRNFHPLLHDVCHKFYKELIADNIAKQIMNIFNIDVSKVTWLEKESTLTPCGAYPDYGTRKRILYGI